MNQAQTNEEGVVIPYRELDGTVLRRIIEEFVARNSEADYGNDSLSMDQKTAQVMAQLKNGSAQLVYDVRSETCNIVSK